MLPHIEAQNPSLRLRIRCHMVCDYCLDQILRSRQFGKRGLRARSNMRNHFRSGYAAKTPAGVEIEAPRIAEEKTCGVKISSARCVNDLSDRLRL